MNPTDQLAGYLAFCENQALTAWPADPMTVLQYLDSWTQACSHQGSPLRPEALAHFGTVLAAACRERGLPDPFETSTPLSYWMRGYAREFEVMHAEVRTRTSTGSVEGYIRSADPFSEKTPPEEAA
jgi:hypothetical protein